MPKTLILRKEGGKQASKHRKTFQAGHWWLTPVILATQEAEIRRITVVILATQEAEIRLEATLGK
jgi:hypothetical protein